MAAKECDELIPYLAGELSEEEEARFREHLSHCPTCAEEFKILSETWHALSYDRDEKEAPGNLKAEVMNYVLPDSQSSPLKQSYFSDWLNTFKKSFTPLTAILVLILFIGGIGVLWNDFHLRKLATEHKEFTQSEPVRIQNTFMLKSENPSSKAQGMVYLVHEGKQQKLVMLLNHLPKPKRDQVYQAWLFYEGQYQYCGSFSTNPEGRGVLTYRLPSKARFDGIMITIESNPDVNQPHGQTVLKTL